MRRLVLAAAVAALFAGSASAQFLGRPSGSAGSQGSAGGTPGGSPLGGGIGSPTPSGFSPYLNLTRGGNSAALNYYGIVRPQFNFQQSLQALQNPAQPGVAQGTTLEDPLMPGLVVGTRARFLNTGGVFLNLNGTAGGAVSGPQTVGPAAGPAQSTLSTPLGGTMSSFGTGIGGTTGGRSAPRR